MAPPQASSGLPSPKRLRAGRQSPRKHTLLRSVGASKGTFLAFIHDLSDRGFLPRRVKTSASEIIKKYVSSNALNLITVNGIAPSPHPSPQWGEGRVRGPHVKEINAFVLVPFSTLYRLVGLLNANAIHLLSLQDSRFRNR